MFFHFYQHIPVREDRECAFNLKKRTMGTNIYLRKIVSKEEIEETKRKLKEIADDVKSIDDMRDVISFLQDEYDRYEKEIHICKISYGWKLLFQANKNLYECTWESMTDYIRRAIDSGEWEMIDEYGDAYSLDDLKEDLEKHKDGFDHDSYAAYMRSKGEYNDQGSIEFISDGLRWSQYDFS